jgi:ABC-2 type transport system permease protein
MKQLLAVAINDIRIELSDRNAWLSLLLLPVLFTAVIGVATGGLAPDADADPRYPVALVNHDDGELSRQFANALAQSNVVRPEATGEADALSLLSDDEVRAVLILPAKFSTNLLAGQGADVELRLPENGGNESLAIREAVQAAAAQVSRAVLAALVSVEEAEAIRPFADDAERDAYFQEALKLAGESAATEPVKVDNTQAVVSANPRIPTGFAQASPGQLVTWVWATLLAGASTLVSERTLGTLRRLLVMPAPKWSLLGGKIVGRFGLGLAQMALMIGVGQFVFNVRWGSSPLALAMVAVCFGLAATALGLLISTLVRREAQADGLVSLSTFLFAPLGGAWFPIEITPSAFQTVSQVFPTHWAMRGFIDIIVRGQGPSGVLLECGVLLGFAALFFAVGVWRFKYE